MSNKIDVEITPEFAKQIDGFLESVDVNAYFEKLFKEGLPAQQQPENGSIQLSLNDQRLFADNILNPPEPNAALCSAFEKHRELFGTKP